MLRPPGFNVIATANLRDRGVNEMSAALKRRFNFETVHADRATSESSWSWCWSRPSALLAERRRRGRGWTRDVLDVLVTTFHELRAGRTAEGTVVERPVDRR